MIKRLAGTCILAGIALALSVVGRFVTPVERDDRY